MSEQLRNVPASIYARLTARAKALGRPFGEVLQYYGMERFLYRLSQTQYHDDFLLKGGLVFYSLGVPLRRPTKDIDLLGSLHDPRNTVSQVVASAMAVPYPQDGLFFDTRTLIVVENRFGGIHNNMTAKFVAFLSRSKIPLHIDFGFSDEIAAPPQTIKFPTLLENMDGASLRSYPVESVVAEKLHAMGLHADVPSRWNDYYDIWLVSKNFQIDVQALEQAIATTFANRKTKPPVGRPAYLTRPFAASYQKAWTAFLTLSDLLSAGVDDFPNFMDQLWSFLQWPLSELGASRRVRVHRHWIPNTRQWV